MSRGGCRVLTVTVAKQTMGEVCGREKASREVESHPGDMNEQALGTVAELTL